MRTKLFTIGFLFFSLSSFAGEKELPKFFSDILIKANMTFEMPKGLIETTVIENQQMNYEFAIKYPDKKFEVRYAIRPLGSMIEDYKMKIKNQKPGDSFADPNKMYPASLQAIAYNISGGKLAKSAEFDKTSVKEEFNADWGSTTFVEVNNTFSQGYKYCMMVAIHKDDCADAYIFFMTDNKDQIMELALPAFYALKFN